MARREFTKTIKVAIIKRATRDGVVYCEKCGLPSKKFNIDHTRPDGLEVDKSKKLTAEEGQLLCVACHKEKTVVDKANIAKAKRREEKSLGIKAETQKIASPVPREVTKPKKNLNPLGPPRPMFY
jgi:hypothetical protein